MAEFRSELVNRLVERGFVHQCTDLEALDALAADGPITGYIGFDCTADSLHVGHQVSLMMLRTLQRTGHRPIALIGGGTTKVGDPSGRDETRQLLDDAAIEANIAGIRRSLGKFLSFGGGGGDALLVNNAAWLDGLRYVPFLRGYGRHFTINRMLTFDSVRQRLEREQPLTFLEFNYMIMQAFDFLQLARSHGCRLQMGGSDQWGNIVNGVELARRSDGLAVFGLTTPLITTASGAKMGKTAQGAVWLNEDRLPPFDYYQYWRNTDDGQVGHFLRLFTELPLDEIARLEALRGAEINEAKRVLAFEATRLCHGEAAARTAAEAAAAMARGLHETATIRASLDAVIVGPGLPVTDVPEAELAGGGISVVDLLHRSGLASSKGEARRLIRGGGARLNGDPITDENRAVTATEFAGGQLTLSAGRKRHVLVRAV
ncbi:MAG TPA: tyrosine--tRNA ligase [Geminicoccaceae bacterium]|nr:tyrosine--tRNA ligase [Geminicoccaceae bacterium]